MKYNPDIHHRRSIRLHGYDYSKPGFYFITICTLNRRCLFGEVLENRMILNDSGIEIHKCWNQIPVHFPFVNLDDYIIMPNHIHGILYINVGAKDLSPLQEDKNLSGTSKTIGSIVRGFKIGATKWIRNNTDIYDLWQRNYYEHIIRKDEELNRIREYIQNNPLKWVFDRNHPDYVGTLKHNEDSWMV